MRDKAQNRVLEETGMYSQEDLRGLAALMSVFRVIMQDLEATQSDVIDTNHL